MIYNDEVCLNEAESRETSNSAPWGCWEAIDGSADYSVSSAQII